MALIVKKFGGSSLATPEHIKKIAKRIVEDKQKNNSIVVVVSASGDTTDDLISMAKKMHPNPPHREMDMLLSTGEIVSSSLMAMAIDNLKEKAVSLTGPQIGIMTDSAHTRASIRKVKTERIKKELQKGNIVVVAGFQGKDDCDEITTLGRGGSDATATALAIALKADVCEIFTDVEGIYTSDPRVVKDAKKIKIISYEEMLEIASSGAQVMQSRSIELASKYKLKLHVRSSFNKKEGTIIMEECESMEKVFVRGVVIAKNEARVTIHNVPNKPGIAAYIFGKIGKEKINVDMIIQSSDHQGKSDISFTVNEESLAQTLEVMERAREHLKAGKVSSDSDIGKIAIVGVGMKTNSGIAGKMFEALAKANINIEMITTSEIRISCAIRRNLCDKAVKVLHKEFELGK
ncbi:MAG: aspartate kinase [Candidatus Omnitrophica bacterium]|nr:aspartate kinase [Candidatus Omnitrophota bacterium]MBU1047227.1 aspartate kinase [Candidatus Omnitrophota bacterium]MBU1631232.1 aspartate kinase [Candidatus Omnitrophota bacterium]MBU1766674.1 aspartate kinase [Candidatus Omnitrophota bacterium]MBU1889187.1 aspartate kinase [Candidatus Omnitrophota bacterium]